MSTPEMPVETDKLDASIVVGLLSRAADRNLTRTQIVKLLYFTDLEALTQLGAPVTGAQWVWWEHGPHTHAYYGVEQGLVAVGLATLEPIAGGKKLTAVNGVRTALVALPRPHRIDPRYGHGRIRSFTGI